HTTGHHNAFPLLPQPGAHKNGAPIDEGLDLGILYERLRGLPSPLRALVQMNHARSSRRGSIWLGYFDSCGYDPSLPLDPASPCFSAMGPMGTRPWDFDAMEVINGNSALGFVHMNRDWLGLLRFAPGGRLPVATANSDSHELVHERAGYPLTLLRVPGPLSSLDDAALVAALEGGSVGGSLGAFVWIGARQAGSSDAFMPPSRIPLAATSLEVEIRLAAAPWVPIDELRLRLGGEVVARLSVSSGDLSAPADPYGVAGIVRYAGVVDLSGIALSADTFLTAEAGFALPRVGDLDGDGLVDATDNDGDDDVDADDLVDGIVLPAPTSPMDVIAPGALPMAFTNPIFIDVDGSAIYEPPMTPLLD
ncbi:MAG: hypothetical protein OEY14_18690, partial [Myxococcales bacterium]|nr:hypothetical protein [Myxococcales bacterium]